MKVKEYGCPIGYENRGMCRECYYWKPGVGCDYLNVTGQKLPEKKEQGEAEEASDGLFAAELDKKWHINR